MRYLNKIIFINSAKISYAEILVDGNVHFIGTQGVGKSTALRAILFFYNADKTRLGIEKSKKTFDEYYFPFADSFVVYEVMRETGPFCILAHKSQGRVAFHFLDGPYGQEHFIDSDGKAREWEKVRNILPYKYSRKVDGYEEYRDILYGNNKGMKAEFRKYALLESRVYQNLPRTIQNVFLNSKLEAEFIKQTIIMSLDEQEMKIDLGKYAVHLRNFEQNLADISKWSEQNRSGEIPVRALATTVSRLYAEISYLERDKIALANGLIDARHHRSLSVPALLRALEHENEKLGAASLKVAEAAQKFAERKEKIVREITLAEDRLSEARRKAADYERRQIQNLILRIASRKELEVQKRNLEKEQYLLSSRFKEITSKYEALMQQVKNQQGEFINLKRTRENELNTAFYTDKELLNTQYQGLLQQIEDETQALKSIGENEVSSRSDQLHSLQLQLKETEYRRWFEKEISFSRQLITSAALAILEAGTEITGNRRQIDSLIVQGAAEASKIELEWHHGGEKLRQVMAGYSLQLDAINAMVSQQKNSLYEWLNENKPGWEQTVGKVIDQQAVLFRPGLNPRLADKAVNQFFGVELDLEELNITVKTLEDYARESAALAAGTKKSEIALTALDDKKLKDLERIRKKYQPQIKELKEVIMRKEYDIQKGQQQSNQARITLADWEKQAQDSQQAAIKLVREQLETAAEEKRLAAERQQALLTRMRNQTEVRKKGRDQKIKARQEILNGELKSILIEIAKDAVIVKDRLQDLGAQSTRVLNAEGADTGRIAEIGITLNSIAAELEFIEQHRELVSLYNRDKAELFDRVDEFKAHKKVNETRLEGEQQKHETSTLKLTGAVASLEAHITELLATERQIQEDLLAFEQFSATDVFIGLGIDIDRGIMAFNQSSDRSALSPPEVRLGALITELKDKSFALITRRGELRAAVIRFSGNFSTPNIFGFKSGLVEDADFLDFAANLKEFLEEDKISEFENRTNEHFASLIVQLSRETTELISKEAVIQKVVSQINRDFEERNFAGVIKGISLRLSTSANKIVLLLAEIRAFNQEFAATLGKSNLFSTKETALNNQKAVNYLKNFAVEIDSSKLEQINLADTFELQFRVIENENDSGWVEKLTHVGSEGTDILVKAMVNIMLLNVFKENAARQFKDFRLHCMMDEIGKLHPNNVKGILKFANDRNIVLINSSPTSSNALDYRHTYKLSKDDKNITTVRRVLTNS